MTADARGAGLPTQDVTVTDTPVARETDYGRVDQHSSAIRAAGDARHTYNRVPDYPVPGTDTVFGGWTGGRITVSSSSSDATAMPDVAPATSPTAAIDGDPATAWVSNALQAAVGQWLQVDFDHPVSNAVMTVTPSATAVGAQVRRIEIETATGSTTLRFDEAGKPLTVALPYGETPWVRLTAAATNDGSAGVQFGITDLSITQYDASGFAHPLTLRHTALVPGPPPGSAVAGWDLGSELLGRPGCAPAPDGVRCAASMALAPEEPVNFSRTLTVPSPMSVSPTLWVRPRQGPKLADLIAEPNTTQAHGDSDAIDILGSAYAATDGDPATAWTAPQRVVQHKIPPTLTLTLPRPTEVAGLRLVPSQSTLPTHPTLVAVNLGDGPQVRELKAGEPQTVSLNPRVTDTVTLSLLDWQDVIDRNALGFDQLKPPGLADVAVLGADGKPIAPADAARNRIARDRRRLRPGPGDRGGRPVCAHLDPDHGGRAAGRRARSRRRLRPRPDRAARWAAGVADQPRRGVRGGRSPAVDRRRRRCREPSGDSGRHRGVGLEPPRDTRARIRHSPGAGHSRKHQPGLDSAHQHRGPVDARGRQRLAAGLGGARGQPRHHHLDLRVQLAVPGGSGAGPGVAAGAGLAGLLAYPAQTRRRGAGVPLGARGFRRGRGNGRRGGDRRRGRGRGRRGSARPAVRAAPP